MLQGPVRDTVWARNLAPLETPDGFVNTFRVGYLVFAVRGQEVRPQHHIEDLINCRDQRISHRLD